MPDYLHLANLIILKSSVIEKYEGGQDQFRIVYSIGISEVNQEDNELFSSGKMNIDGFDVERLI